MTDIIMGEVMSRTRITKGGEFQEYYEVEFFVDDARHKLEMSPEGFTAEKAEEAVRVRAAELAKVKGKKIKL